MLGALYILVFLKNSLCFTEPVATWSVTSMHIFCNLLKLRACFSVTNSTTTDELSLPVIFFLTLELHCLVVVVSVDHMSLLLADCCT